MLPIIALGAANSLSRRRERDRVRVNGPFNDDNTRTKMRAPGGYGEDHELAGLTLRDAP
jgi:hypothetical protein